MKLLYVIITFLALIANYEATPVDKGRFKRQDSFDKFANEVYQVPGQLATGFINTVGVIVNGTAPEAISNGIQQAPHTFVKGVNKTGAFIVASPDILVDGIRKTPTIISGAVNTTTSVIAATPQVVSDGIQQAPDAISTGVLMTENFIAETPGALVNGIKNLGTFGVAVVDNLYNTFGK